MNGRDSRSNLFDRDNNRIVGIEEEIWTDCECNFSLDDVFLCLAYRY